MSNKIRKSTSTDLKIPLTIKKQDSRSKMTNSPLTARKSQGRTLRKSGIVAQSPFDRRRIVIEKWHSGVVPVSATMSHNLAILDSTDVTVNVLTKVNHILIDNCSDIILRLEGGVVSLVEIVHCKNVSVIAKSKVPVIQVDMTDHCRLYYPTAVLKEARVIHASSPDLEIYEVKGTEPDTVRVKHEVPFSMFDDHQIVYYDAAEERLSTVDMDHFKNGPYYVIP